MGNHRRVGGASRPMGAARKRKRAFATAVRKLFDSYERRSGIEVPFEMPDEEVAAWCERDPEFAAMVGDIQTLRGVLLGY